MDTKWFQNCESMARSLFSKAGDAAEVLVMRVGVSQGQEGGVAWPSED